MTEPKYQGKSHDIPKQLVWDAWLKVKENGGAAGADGVTIEQFEADLKSNLYKLWNRMSSGSYFPGSVRGGDTEERRNEGSRNPERDRSGGTDRGGAGVGVERGEGVPQRFLRLSARAVTDRRGQGMLGTVLEKGLDR